MNDIKVLLLVDNSDAEISITISRITKAEVPIGSLVVAHSVVEAREKLAIGTFDLMLLELDLGSTVGLVTLTEIRPCYTGVLVVLTSNEDEKLGMDAIHLGADDFLVKSHLNEYELRRSISLAQARHTLKETFNRAHENLNALERLVVKE